MECDRVWCNARLATMQSADLAVIENGLVAARGETIVYAGPEDAAPQLDAAQTIDCERRWITPGLIDCHTHLVFGGNRADEFEQRLLGRSYADIARAGGGILSTVRSTRAADEEQLFAAALPRLERLIAEGVGTMEIKSGYGLTIEDELKMLRVARRLGDSRDIQVLTSYLAAHAIPPEYAGRADEYVDAIVVPGLRRAAAEGLVDAVDAFCETIAFSPAQVARVFDAADELGLPIKLHAEQLTNLGGAAMVARRGGLSADHLEYLDAAGVDAMAAAGTVAVLLPGAFYALREPQAPPVALLRRTGVPMAVATDCNPGSSPLTSLLLAVNMACVLFGLTPEEALAGVTRNAARGLGLDDRGIIAPGMRADLAVWDIKQPAELAYRIGFNPLVRRIVGGRT